MARRKSEESKSRERTVQEKLELARQMRLAMAASKRPRAEKASGDAREKFRSYWALNRRKYGRPRELEETLWAHLASIGATSEDRFEDGLRHFGLEEKGE